MAQQAAPPFVSAPGLDTVVAALPTKTLLLAPDSPRFTILAASDAYLSATLTTRASVVGRPLFEAFPDANPENDAPDGVATLRASLDTVLKTGTPQIMRVLRFDLQRADGSWEERHWVPHNVPVLGSNGEVEGLLHHANDVTEQVRLNQAALAGETERGRLVVALAAERERLRSLILQLPVPVALHEGPEHRFTLINAAFQRVSGDWRDLIGRTPRETFPELEGHGVFERLDHVYATGERAVSSETLLPYDRDGSGAIRDAWVTLSYQPVRDVDGHVIGVLNVSVDVTEQVEARHEVERLLAASDEAASRLAISEAAARRALDELEATYRTAPVGLAVIDTGLRFQRINARLAETNGLPVEAHLGRTVREVVPGLADAVEPRLRHVLATGVPEFDVPVSGETAAAPGAVRHWIEHWLPLRDQDGTVIGVNVVAEEVTERRAAEAERARLLAEAEAARAEAESARGVSSALIESVRDAFVAYDADFRFTYINAAAAELFEAAGGASPVGQVLWDAYPQLLNTPLEDAMRRAMTERVPVHFDTHDPLLRRWTAVRAYPAATGGLTAVWTDVTVERRAREAAAFLVDVSRVLAASLDYAVTLSVIAEAAVPRLGDWCAVDMVLDPAARLWPPSVERIAVVHQDPAMLALGEKLSAGYPTDWSAADGMAAVLRDGVPFFVPEITDAMVVAGAQDPEHLAILRAMRFSSILVVPLVARGLTLGALTLCMTESGRRYDDADRDLALEVAQRAALAVDNARLFREAEQARAEAERMRAEAEAANAAKTMFLSSMSHELRTPLHAIGGYADMLTLGVRGPITDAQRQDLDRVRMANQHLLSLVNDILNFARVDAGQLEYRLADLELAVLVAELEPLIAPQFATKRISFDHDGCASDTPEKPHRVRADPEKLRQILLNLLTNAVKFTPAGGHVTLDCATDAAAGLVFVRVTDTGRGIPADQLEHIFEPFVQVDRHRTPDGQQGVGLGLAISRELARAMGGDLTVASHVGTGSTFTVVLCIA